MNPDELAGVVDLFGALSHPELEEALEEYAFRQDVEVPEGLVEEALERYRADVDAAVEAGTDDEIRRLLDVSYDLEAWGPVDVADARERLDAALNV